MSSIMTRIRRLSLESSLARSSCRASSVLASAITLSMCSLPLRRYSLTLERKFPAFGTILKYASALESWRNVFVASLKAAISPYAPSDLASVEKKLAKRRSLPEYRHGLNLTTTGPPLSADGKNSRTMFIKDDLPVPQAPTRDITTLSEGA